MNNNYDHALNIDFERGKVNEIKTLKIIGIYTTVLQSNMS